MLRWVLALSVLAGCGRLSFDRATSEVMDDARMGDSATDAARPLPRLLQSASSEQLDSLVATVVLDQPTQAGSLLVVATLNYNLGDVAPLTTVTSDGVPFTSANARALWNGDDGACEIWYAAVAAGTTKVTLESPQLTNRYTWVLELANVSTLDEVGSVSNAMSTGSPQAPLVTLQRSPAVVVSILMIAGFAQGISAGNDFIPLPTIDGDSTAYRIADQPGSYGARWDSTGVVYAASTAAFVE
jgi:hypothetical protein